MFIAINNLKAKAGRGGDLEASFAKPRGLEQQSGFISFELLKQTWGSDEPDEPYLVMTRWQSMKDFMAWAKSDSFKEAHAGPKPDFLAGGGHPGGYEVCLERRP